MRLWSRRLILWLLLVLAVPVPVLPAPPAASCCCAAACEDNCCDDQSAQCNLSSCPQPLSSALPEGALPPLAPQVLAAVTHVIESLSPPAAPVLLAKTPARSRDPAGIACVSPLHRNLPPPRA